MIHNRLKFTSQLISPRGWMVWLGVWVNQVSIPATRRYCLATLMSSDRTKQICLWMTIYISKVSDRSRGSLFNTPTTLKCRIWRYYFALIDALYVLSVPYNIGTLAQRLECSPMARETWVQSQVESYQRL